MKSLFYFIASLLFVLLLLQSCTLEKRHYTSGYHVEWNRHDKFISKLDSPNPEDKDQITTSVYDDEHDTTVDLVHDSVLAQSTGKADELKSLKFTAENASEIILLSKFDQDDQQPDVAAKDNSGLLAFSDESNIDSHNGSSNNHKMNAPSKSSAGGKNQIVALILCIFLGLLGIHRFYLGYTGMGILYLLTLGLLGIGWIIDLILLIIPNGLTPKGKTSYRE